MPIVSSACEGKRLLDRSFGSEAGGERWCGCCVDVGEGGEAVDGGGGAPTGGVGFCGEEGVSGVFEFAV